MIKEKLNLYQWVSRIVINILGLFLCGLGIVLAVQCGVGASPWDVLQVGMTNYIPITLGQASQIIAFILLIFTWYKGVIPGVGTILNAYFIGFFIDVVFKFGINTPETLFMQLIMLFSSIIIFGFGIVISLKTRIGVGSRDALMEYLITRTKVSVIYIRAALEIFALIGGLILKGPFGFGTVIAALSLGYAIKFAAKVLRYDFDTKNHYTFKDILINSKREKSNMNLNN